MRGFLRRLKDLLHAQLMQGATPEGLALSFAVGITIGNFPIFGTTTVLCALLGHLLKLNQPTAMAANYLVVPTQVILIPVFLRLGETITGAAHLTLNPAQLSQEFMHSPQIFLERFGWAVMQMTFAWALVAAILGVVSYHICLRIFRRLQKIWS